MNALKNLSITAMAAILTSCSYAQSGFSGKSWSAGPGIARLVNLPLTDRVIEHWSNPDGSRLFTSFSLRQTRHWQLSYGQHQAINQWLNFKWMVHVNSWGFFLKEQLRYQEPLIQLPTPSNRIPPIQMTTYRSLSMWSVSALPGLFADIPLGGRVSFIMGSYAGLMTSIGNIYPDEQLFYRHHVFTPGFHPLALFESGLEYIITPKTRAVRCYATHQWGWIIDQPGTGLWQNVPGFNQLQLGLRVSKQ
jgi:hypothetical protein